MKRNIIIHYHLFKNAGTSIDNILKSSFGSRWQNWDKPEAHGVKIFAEELAGFICNNPHLKAISSHQALMPLPVGDFQVFPIFFLRHPILRAKSAWKFEWHIQNPKLDGDSSFKAYLDFRFQNTPGVICNFQNTRLSNVQYTTTSENIRQPGPFERLELAKTCIDSTPYFGIVEHMHTSLERLHYFLKAAFPEIRVINARINSSIDKASSIQDALSTILEEIGQEHFDELMERNKQDLELYQYATDRFFSIIPKK